MVASAFFCALSLRCFLAIGSRHVQSSTAEPVRMPSLMSQPNWNQLRRGLVLKPKKRARRDHVMPILIWITTMAFLLEMSGTRLASAMPERDRSKELEAPQPE
jgi:hypothetical protein